MLRKGMSEQATAAGVYNILPSAKTSYFPRLLKHEIVQQQAQRTFDGKSNSRIDTFCIWASTLNICNRLFPHALQRLLAPACKDPYMRCVHFRST